MEKFKLSSEDIELLENKLQALANLLRSNGYDDDGEDLFANEVIGHLDELINEF